MDQDMHMEVIRRLDTPGVIEYWVAHDATHLVDRSNIARVLGMDIDDTDQLLEIVGRIVDSAKARWTLDEIDVPETVLSVDGQATLTRTKYQLYTH